MWSFWCDSAAQDAATVPFSWRAHFRNSYPAPLALAPNCVLRDDGRRQRRPMGFPGRQLAAEDNGFEFDTNKKADGSSSLTAVVCVLVRSDRAKSGLVLHGENP